ncbi:MAG: 2-succinyl-5-enolpyruvyl-6-hydroxy-3-cyclohexene-1-carboxylic-acid synthase [Bacteroidales bacterium]|nr:2-succinyl-5-enolpyruvyl-6-hydroxy-3-cyclohexene-1-carboxylic-acid synthase [Bacteroidales bacterium]
MIHKNQHITEIVQICSAKQLKHVVISPGSRNAPLINAFIKSPAIQCISIADERSAAYYALGIAQQTRKPVGIVCTSGTAVLNFSPAIAEAYYQHLPLVVFTADRPAEWIDQQDNQSIHQNQVFSNFVKKSFTLPQEVHSENDIWFAQRSVSEAINIATQDTKGPVHINVPLTEPLYENSNSAIKNIKIINVTSPHTHLHAGDEEIFIEKWNAAEKKLIVCGQYMPDKIVQTIIEKLSLHNSVAVIAENISNISGKQIIDTPDPVLAGLSKHEEKILAPDLLISFGGPVVSKRLKQFLRKNQPAEHWLIDPGKKHTDTFQSLTQIIPVSPSYFLELLADNSTSNSNSNYNSLWLQKKMKYEKNYKVFLEKISWSDLKVFELLHEFLPDNINLHLGNSSPVRYTQLFPTHIETGYFSNRGTSGIDGVLSTAAGAAGVSSNPTVVILGDMGFVYDSNALWNKNLSKNLKIIVINNKGGGIFRLIDGPTASAGFQEFFEAFHPVNFEHLVKAFGLSYYFCDAIELLVKVFPGFLSPASGASVLVIDTPNEINAQVYKEYFKFLSH